MKLTQLVQKSIKTDPDKEDLSKNARLLTKAGYVNCLTSGVYTYLPLGLRVLRKVEDIVRDEMNKLGAQEVLMPILTPKDIWEKTGRWGGIDVLFKLKGHGDKDYALGATHEEVAAPLMMNYMTSYKDFPKAIYQIQSKFRNEARAKSGVLRGKEFRMKDLYSFHTNQKDLDEFYDRAIITYKKIYERCGIGDKTILTCASGGIFSKYSHEFQTITPAGEDIIYKVRDDLAINDEIIDDASVREEFGIKDKNDLKTEKTIEVGNIFKLGTKYSAPFGFKYNDANGQQQTPIMGCYGIGTTRLMGAVVECLGDDKGLVWPEELTPFKIHLVGLTFKEEEIAKCNEIYESFLKAGFDVLYDDRIDIKAGEKLNDADLIGIPHRVVVSSKTLAQDKVEYKHRTSQQAELLSLEELINRLK